MTVELWPFLVSYRGKVTVFYAANRYLAAQAFTGINRLGGI